MSTASHSRSSEPLPPRVAGTSDIPALTRLINAAFVVEQIAFDGPRVDHHAVRAYLTRGTFLIAEDSGAPVGCVYIQSHENRSYLGLLSVDPARQRSGLGRQLVAAAEALARKQGSRFMDLRVISPRAAQLRPFYERLGYHFIANEPFPPDLVSKVPAHYLLMSKPLS